MPFCNRCETEKAARDFWTDLSKKTGYSTWCKSCHRSQKKEAYHTWPGFIMRRIQLYRFRAKQLQVPFDLTIDFLKELWSLQSGCCAISGIPFEPGGFGKRHPFSPSLDRKDSDLGYTKENVQWVANIVNYGKNEWGEDAFLKMCSAVVHAQNKLWKL